MQIRKIEIERWRNFEGLTLELREGVTLVCLVGANGTGKTHILELISACAHHFGLSAGIEIPRGDPFQDDHSFSVEIYLPQNISQLLDQAFQAIAGYDEWDRTLILRSETRVGIRVEAGGIVDDKRGTEFATQIVKILRESQEVHLVSLDADRAYPKANIAIHEIAQAYETDWDAPGYTRGRSFMPARTLYDEWLKYFLAKENQAGTNLMQGMRRARESGEQDPIFEDHFEKYKSALQKVLPHLAFTGVDPKKRTLLFDTTGIELSFDQLSGGERELGFLVGQIDRFRLRNGLFLLDEPELHLNNDLIRTWISYLSGTIMSGQVWLATHSLEAVEAAGQDATFLLERNVETKKVDKLANLSTLPIQSALSRAVGTPAFSLSSLRFIFVEGEDGIGERERFRRVCGDLTDSRFIECGSCNEVSRRVSTLKSLSEEARQEIRVGGIVDRDWRSTRDADELAAKGGIFVLPIHEIENLFLHPATLEHVLQQNGISPARHSDFLRGACDNRAGGWIYQQAWARVWSEFRSEPHRNAKSKAFELNWDAISPAIHESMKSIVDQEVTLTPEQQTSFLRTIEACARAYRRIRMTDDLWKRCEGKEVFRAIAQDLGFANARAAERAILTAWASDEALLPGEVEQIRTYVAGV